MLEEYLKKLEEAKKRDHNKLGRELELFTTVDYIGQGFLSFCQRVLRLSRFFKDWLKMLRRQTGCLLTKTPLMAKRDLYKISGHWDHYLDGMFVLGDR